MAKTRSKKIKDHMLLAPWNVGYVPGSIYSSIIVSHRNLDTSASRSKRSGSRSRDSRKKSRGEEET
jgi:hypothetical protein